MATAAFTTSGDILKKDYQPTIQANLNDAFLLLNQIERGSHDVEGVHATVAIHTGRNDGTGARAELADLPTAGHQKVDQIDIPLKYNYARFAVSGPIIQASQSDKGSFDRIVDFNSKRMVVDLRRDVNRQLYTPASGVLAVITANDAAGSPGTITFATEAEALYFEPESTYQVMNGTSDTVRGTFVVADVNEELKSIETVGNIPAGTTTADTIVKLGTVPSQDDEITGLITQVDSTGTLWGRAATGVWKSYEENVAAAPSDLVFQRAMDRVHLRSGSDIDLLIASHACVRAYAASLVSQKRYSADKEVTLKGGFAGISVNAGRGSVVLTAERDCPDGTVFGISTDTWKFHESSDWEFMDMDGSVWNRVPNKDAYEATLYHYGELATWNRRANFKLSGLVTGV